jgi:RNA 3'-terminal phosphate cyclase (ATP)
MKTVTIDGSMGEGGGQVLRSALTLSALTGQAAHITNIRARRSKVGLRAQHLTAVEAVAKLSGAQVQGAEMGSTELIFEPGEIQPGFFRFDIRTAGATSLVMQTVLLPLSMADETSTVAITGGTHVRWSPCYHYLDWHWQEMLVRIGYDARLTLKRAGFYPQGGGRIQAVIRPAGRLKPLELTDRGDLVRITGLSAIANLPDHIAERQRRQALRRLKPRFPIEIEFARLPSPGKGTVLLLLAEFENARYCTFALGERGKPAERVADEAVDELEAFLTSDAALDRYLADQLLLPLAIAPGGSSFTTEKVTTHLTTNAQVLMAFTPVDVQIQGEIGEPGRVQLTPPAGGLRPGSAP